MEKYGAALMAILIGTIFIYARRSIAQFVIELIARNNRRYSNEEKNGIAGFFFIWGFIMYLIAIITMLRG